MISCERTVEWEGGGAEREWVEIIVKRATKVDTRTVFVYLNWRMPMHLVATKREKPRKHRTRVVTVGRHTDTPDSITTAGGCHGKEKEAPHPTPATCDGWTRPSQLPRPAPLFACTLPRTHLRSTFGCESAAKPMQDGAYGLRRKERAGLRRPGRARRVNGSQSSEMVGWWRHGTGAPVAPTRQQKIGAHQEGRRGGAEGW